EFAVHVILHFRRISVILTAGSIDTDVHGDDTVFDCHVFHRDVLGIESDVTDLHAFPEAIEQGGEMYDAALVVILSSTGKSQKYGSIRPPVAIKITNSAIRQISRPVVQGILVRSNRRSLCRAVSVTFPEMHLMTGDGKGSIVQRVAGQ